MGMGSVCRVGQAFHSQIPWAFHASSHYGCCLQCLNKLHADLWVKHVYTGYALGSAFGPLKTELKPADCSYLSSVMAILLPRP